MVQTVYYMKADELGDQFVESLRTLFKDKEIEIIVNEVDETAYLLRSEANRQRLLQALERADDPQYLVEVDLDTLP